MERLRLFFMGTCRVYEPQDRLLSRFALPVAASMHRVHNAGQALHLARVLRGERPMPDGYLHTLSDRAFRLALEEPRFRQKLKYRHAQLGDIRRDYDAFVIEVSSRKHHVIDAGDGPFSVNTFTRRDVEAYADRLSNLASIGKVAPIDPTRIVTRHLSSADIRQQMRACKAYLGGKPILWVSHVNIPRAESEETALQAVRAEHAAILAEQAHALGDPFLDPTDLARVYGRERIFAKEGRDLDHLSPLGVEVMAGVYARFVLPQTWAATRAGSQQARVA